MTASGTSAWVVLDRGAAHPRLVRLDQDGRAADRTPTDYFGSIPAPQPDGSAYVLSNTHLLHLAADGTQAQTSSGGLFAEADRVLGVVQGRLVVHLVAHDDGPTPERLMSYDPLSLRRLRSVNYRGPALATFGSVLDAGGGLLVTSEAVVEVDPPPAGANDPLHASLVSPDSGAVTAVIGLAPRPYVFSPRGGSVGGPAFSFVAGRDVVVGFSLAEGSGRIVGVRRLVTASPSGS